MPSAVDGKPEPIPAPGPDTPDSLCLGAEFKFLLLGLPWADVDTTVLAQLAEGTPRTYEADRDMAHAAVARQINKNDAGCRAISKPELEALGHAEKEYWPSHWIVKKANSVLHGPDDRQPPADTNGVVVACELNTPQLVWRDARVPEQVGAVLGCLNRLPTAVNDSCDMHVHVGRTDGQAFSLHTLKRLAALLWLAEPVVRSVRDPNSRNYTHAYTWGFAQRRESRLARALEQRVHPDDPVRIGEEMLARIQQPDSVAGEAEWRLDMHLVAPTHAAYAPLRAIWRCTSSHELGLLLSGSEREHRRLGFNFSAFGGEDERARTNPRTVEFRVLDGTLDAAVAQAWLVVCGSLVELATKGCEARFAAAMAHLLAHQDQYAALDAHMARQVAAGVKRRRDRARGPRRHRLFGAFMTIAGVDDTAVRLLQQRVRRQYSGP